MGDFERRRGDLALGARARGDFERRGGMRASFLERAAAARSAACRRAAVSATAAAWTSRENVELIEGVAPEHVRLAVVA